MKIKFRIRTILLMTLALGIALACLRWVQQERLKHADALQAKFAEMGVHNGFVPNVFPFQAEKKDPTLKEQLFGNTKNVFSEPCFDAIDIAPKDADFFISSNTTQSIWEVSFVQTRISPEARCFLSDWKSLERVFFCDVTIPKSWAKEIAENRNLKELIFIGQSSGFSITELKQLGHLNWLALDKNLLDPQAKEALIKAIPNTDISFHPGARQ